MELHPLILSILILIIVSDTHARSLETPVQCATTCTEPENILFHPGQTFYFGYDAEVVSSFQTDADDDSRTMMEMRTTVLVDSLSTCEMVLRLQNSEITSDESLSRESRDAWIESLEQNPLHFSWNDGRIPEVCASNDDPKWVLNIKRGILSLLQVSSIESADNVKETDVTGRCKSTYSVESDGNTRTVNKSKDYNTCQDRDEYLLFSYFTSYNIDSPRQNFIYSSQNCQQEIVSGLINTVQCAEKHTFRPFSNEQSGAQTKIIQQLEFLQTRYSLPSQPKLTAANSRRTDITFEKESDVTEASRDITETQLFFRELCLTMDGEDYVQVGKDFVKLIALLRRLDSSALEQVQSSLEGTCDSRRNAFRQMFEDALQWCGSEGCVVFTARLIAQGRDSLSDDVASRWLNGMSLITKPTLPMLSSVMEIVRSGRMPETSYLIAGTMIHRLCKTSTGNCLSQPDVRNALVFFEEKLGSNCHTGSENRKQEILLALRALGNAGRTNLISTLVSCVSETDNDMETRIATIDTFRRMPCGVDRSVLSRMLMDFTQDSEIRIGSYLGLMKCPTPTLIESLIILLDGEEVQQVSSYVWSHLNQLMKSKDPLKGYIKPLLMETEFAKKHDLDPRKYSRYYEASIFSDQLNAGATFESSVIWSPKSFVPRSADLGLTVDVFGQAVNLLEVGGRAEGIEALIQSAMASDNFLKDNPLDMLFAPNSDAGSDDDEDDEDAENESEDVAEMDQRSARSTDTQLVERQRREFKSGLNTENVPNANWYFRVFGNEMMYGNLRSLRRRPEVMNVQSVINRLIQTGKYEYHDNSMIMNSQHVLPTGVGFPLTVAFNGSASVDINVNGQMDLKSLFDASPAMTLNGLFEPRATVVVSGTMEVDAHLTKTGIATESSVLTSMRMSGKASLKNGRNLKVSIDTPYNKNTFFKFNHKVMRVIGEEMRNSGDEQRNLINDCSQEIAGQKFCIEKPRSFEIFPVTGPITMSAYIKKTESDIKKYQLSGQINTESFPTAFSMRLEADTPNTRTNRRAAIDFQYNLADKNFSLNYNGYGNAYNLEGQVESETTRKTLALTYTKNEVVKRFESTFEHRRTGDQRTWIATSQLQLPEQETISSIIHASIDPYRNISANISIENLYSSPVLGNFSLQDKSETNSLNYYGEAHLKIPNRINNGGNFNLKFLPRSDNFRFGLDYEFNNMKKERIIFNHKRQNLSTRSQTQWRAHQKFTMTQYAVYNHHVDLSFSNDDEGMSSMVKFSYGSQAGQHGNQKFILFNESFSYSNTESRKGFNGHFKLVMPQFPLRFSANVDHLRDDALFNTTVTVQDYAVQLVTQNRPSENGLLNKSIHVEIPTPWGSVRIEDTIVETRKNVYELTGMFRLGSSRGLAMRGTCTLENLRQRKSISINVHGDNDQTLLNAESLLEFSNDFTFVFNNNMRSKYNDLVSLNIRREAYQLDGTRNEIEFSFEPTKYYSVVLASTNDYATLSFKYKDHARTRRFMTLEGRKIVNENHYNGTLSFTNNVGIFEFRNLAVSADYSTSSSRVKVETWYKKDDSKIMGMDFTRLTTPSQTSLSLHLLQQICREIPRDIHVEGSFVQSDNPVVSASLRFDQLEKIGGRFNIDYDESTARGNIRHQFDQLTIPSSVDATIQMNSDRASLTLNYASQEIVIRINRESETSIRFQLVHDDQNLDGYFLPRNIEAQLNYGSRTIDNGKGIWLIAVLDGRNLNSELMLFKNRDSNAIDFTIDHNLEQSNIPKVNAKAYNQRGQSQKIVGAFVESNNVNVTNFYFDLASNAAEIVFKHQLPVLSNYEVPRNMKAKGSFEGALSRFDATLLLELNDLTTQMNVRTNQNREIVNFQYNSDMFYSLANLGFVISKSENEISFNITKGAATFDADLSLNINEQPLLDFSLRQNLFIDGWFVLPRKIKLFFESKRNRIDLSWKYNRYSGSVEIDRQGDLSSRNGMVSLRWRSLEKLRKVREIPQNFEVALSLTNGNTGSANLTWNDQSISTSATIDTSRKSFTFTLQHSFDVLSNFGVSESLSIAGSANLVRNEQDKTIDFEGSIEFDNENYRVYFHNYLDTDAIPMQINTAFGHDIVALSNMFNIPLEVTLKNNISYSVDSDYSSITATLSTDISRAYLESVNPVKNNMQLSLTFMPFTKKLDLSFLHDFSVPEYIPHLLKFDVSVSIPVGQSAYTYRGLNVGLQRDSLKENAELTFSVRKAPGLKQSITFLFRHNATQLYNYGIPKTMTISLEGNTIFNTELGITYDTSKKSIGFDVDYHGSTNHLVTMFYHNFTVLSNIGIPKRLGFDIKASVDLKREAELTLTTYYNKQINNGHIKMGWNLRDYSFEYKHHHNATAMDFIPKQVKAETSNTIEESEISSNTRIRIGRDLKIHFRSDLSRNPSSGKMMGTFHLKQRGIEILPKTFDIEIEMSLEEILLNIMVDRDKFLGIAITPTLNKQNLFASIQVEVHQRINNQYPQSISLYANSSIHAGADAYLKLLTNSDLAFEMGIKSKYNLESKKFSIALMHSENSWKQTIPKNINFTLQYDLSMTTNSVANFEVDLDVLWGAMEKSLDFSTNYASPKRQTYYLDANLQHDFNNFADYVPLQTRGAVLFELDDTTGILQANASVDGQVFIHSAEVTYNEQDNDIEASIKIKINNDYLTDLEIPYLVGGELTANWENPIETNLKTDWNAESANFHFFFDPTSKAEFNVSHTFDLLFRSIDFALKLPISKKLQVVVGLDGEEKTIDLTGDFNQGRGQIEFTHNFESLPAKQVALECNYRLTPDYHVAIIATVDGEEYRVEGGFRNLNNGFHVTTTLLDNISRSVTGRYQTISGGISLDIEHTIPELSSFIPESAGVSASIQQTPNFNLTASVRKQDKTQIFTAATDTSRLQFRLTHDFESLPIPQSMLVQITTLPNPQVRVVINNFERFVSLSVDKSNLRVQLTHVVPELDQLFVPRDLILGIKLFDNSIGGELYVSIDGDERRLGGSANRGIINLYQTLSESTIPRNITLNVSGTLWPLNGAVSLTIDEVERLIGTEINTRSWFLASTIQVPELEPYVPRHVSAKLNFDKYSAQFAGSFFKNNRNQTFVARYDVQGPVQIEITQNLELLSDLPSHLQINLDLNKETKTVSVGVTVNDNSLSLVGKLLIDNDGWYGITINGNQNFKFLTKQWKIARKPEIELLGKLEDKIFSGDVSIKLIKRHFYDADFVITPIWKRKRKGLTASYIHLYDDLTRNVSGSLFFIKQRGEYRFSFEGKQTLPLEKEIELGLRISPPSSQEISFTLEATAKQNLDELVSRQIPERILGNIALNVNPDELRARVESALTYDESSMSLAVDLHPENTDERMNMNANVIVSKNGLDKKYSLRAQYLPQEQRGDGWFEVTNTETEAMERSDHVSFHYTVGEQIVTGAIGMQQRELNELGVPQEISASLERSEGDINKHWRFNFTIAGEPSSVVIDFVQDNSPFRLDVGASFDSATTILTENFIPSHAAVRLTASSNSENSGGSFKVEYEDKFFVYSGSQSHTQTSATASQEIRTNYEKVSEWLGGSNVLETYSYTINEQQLLRVIGSVTKDGAVTSTYNFTMDLETKEFTYNGLYHEHGYDIVFRNVYTDEKSKLVFTVSEDAQMLVNVDWMLSETSGDFLIAYDFSPSQNLYGMPSHFLMRETFALKNSKFEENFRMEYNEEFVKCGVLVNWSKNSGNVGYEIESNAQEFREYLGFGKIKEVYEYSFSNKMFSLVSHTTIDNEKISNSTFVLNGKEYTLKCSFNDNGYEASYRNSFTDEDKSLFIDVEHNGKTIFRINVRLPTNNQASFDFESIHRIKYLKKLGLMKVIRAEGVFEHSTGTISASITAGRSTLFEIERSSQVVTARVRDFKNNLLFDGNANYRLHPEKFVRAQISSSPLNLEADLTTKLVMFERGTGNSSLNFVLNVNSNQFSISGFAVPSSTHDAADFLARLETSSTFAVLPFSVGMMFNSTMDIPKSHYIGDYKVVVNSQTLNVQVDSSLKHINVSITQPWFMCAPVISFSSKISSDSDNNKMLRTKIQWTEQPQDSLSFTGKMKNTGIKISYFAQISQPSNLLSVSNIAADVFGNFDTRDVYSVGFNTVVDEYENGVNATYTGVLPQLFGTHDLNVNITQSFLDLPSKSTTKGLIKISQSLYNSSWSIKSNGRQLVSLEKTFTQGNNRAALGLKWRQSLFEQMFLSYANMEFVAGTNSGRAQLQINDMPEMSASYAFGNDEENHNKTLSVKINSGLLSNFVKFRTFSWSSWLKHEDSQKYNHNSHTAFVIDGKTHFFNLEYVGVIRNNKTHWKVDSTIGHPYNLNVFGTTLPKLAQVSFKLIHKNGGRVFFTYTDDTRQKPFGIKSTYGLQDASHLFSVKNVINLEHCEDPFEIDVSLKRDSLTVSVQCAEKQWNHEMVIEFKNNAELLDLSYSLKNFVPRPKEQTELAVSFMKNSGVMEIRLASPKIERTVLRGDLSSILSQGKRLVHAILAESRTSSLSFIYSINKNQDEYDMYVGYRMRRGATYTLHLRTSWNSGAPFAAVELKKNFELQTELARATVKLIEGRLIQIKLNGNPALINFVRTAIQNIDGEIEHKINVLAENLIKALNLIKPVVVENDQRRENFVSQIDELISKVEEARLLVIGFVKEFSNSCTDKFSLVELATETGARNALTSLLEKIESIKDVLARPFTDVYDQYVGVMIRKTNSALIEKLRPVIVILRKVNAGELLIELVEEGIQNTYDYVMRSGEISFAILRQPLSDLLYVDESNIILNIPLDIDISELKPLPTLGDIKTWLARSALASTINNGIEKLYSYADDYYKARALVYIPRDEILPPFKGHAFVSDFRHFSTFDKRHYNFSSGCPTSHVLAADMRDNNFTVAITYGDSTDRSNMHNGIEVVVGNSHVIVYENYVVKLNNRRKELPLVLENMSVMLEGSTIHVRRNKGDLDVACDFTKKLCTVDVSPYYFGATAGMAGVYNNEPMDDFKAPSRQVVSTAAELAAAWESTGTECSTGNTYEPCRENAQRCISLFKESDSPLRACFPLVDPEPFMAMCNSDMCDNSESSCASVHAYAYRCALVGARVKLPDECVSCSMVDERQQFDSSMSRNTRISSVDLVLVVEQGRCMGERYGISRTAKKFLKKLSTSMKRQRVRHIRYQLVGYGGPGASASPNTITIRRSPTTKSHKQLKKAIGKIAMSSNQMHADTLSAISYASQLPFRAGAKPIIVVLPCDSCHASKVSYSDVEWQIRKRGISLHHVPQGQIKAGRNSKSIYGFDQENAFSQENRSVSSVFIKPNKNDMCEPLATRTGGSVWDQEKMSNNRFIAKFSDYLASKVNRGDNVRCECEMNEAGIATSVCTAVDQD